MDMDCRTHYLDERLTPFIYEIQQLASLVLVRISFLSNSEANINSVDPAMEQKSDYGVFRFIGIASLGERMLGQDRGFIRIHSLSHQRFEIIIKAHTSSFPFIPKAKSPLQTATREVFTVCAVAEFINWFAVSFSSVFSSFYSQLTVVDIPIFCFSVRMADCVHG